MRFLHRNTRRGTAAIEFTFITPTLVILLLAVVEYGNYFRQLNLLNSIAHDAARAGVTIDQTDDPDLRANAKAHELMFSFDIECIYCVEATVNYGSYDTLTVQVKEHYLPIVGLLPTPEWVYATSTHMLWDQS